MNTIIIKTIPVEINLMAILHSFPKLTAAGPSFCAPLIDVAEVPMSKFAHSCQSSGCR